LEQPHSAKNTADISVSLSVLIPAYNEGQHIGQNLREVTAVLDRSFQNYEVIVVDDASLDNTYEAACKTAQEDDRIKVIRAERNGGKGHALRLGFQSSQGQDVVFLDADLDLPPDQIASFVEYLHENDLSVVVGSKRHPQSKIAYPETRKFLSHLYGTTVRLLFQLPIRDTQTGLKVYRRRVLAEVFPLMRCERFAFDLELIALAHQRGYRMGELPVQLRFRRKMRFGRIRLWDFFLTALDTLGILVRVRLLGQKRSSRKT